MRDSASQPERESSRRQYCFGEFTLDLDAGLLRRGAQEVTLRSKPFEVLVYLVEHHGRLVTKDALLEAVWPDAAVTDNSLAQCLLEIRRALGDESQQLIRTIKRRGYMFAAPVTTSETEVHDHVQAVDTDASSSTHPPLVATLPSRNRGVATGFAVALGLVVAFGALLRPWSSPSVRQVSAYEQLTNFPDAAVSPALSPDGRMLAFIRSSDWFLTPDPIYIKMLPDGEPVQLTNDRRWKYGLNFSPDGSQIAYTVSERGPLGWKTYVLSVLGGEPKLLLPNSSGVTWLDGRRLLFSEIRAGEHMGLVTATANRSEYRKIYFPKNERGMVHLAYPSPDRRWALALEMDPVWHPCRLIPLDGSSEGREVGPRGKCTSAAWSPDGKWMYFGVEVQGKHHLWRQRFMHGKPEQLTFGATEEDGVAVAPDGRSLITSVGVEHSVLWIHDQQGDRPISSEGYVVSRPGWSTSVKFSPDGKRVFYLMRRQSTESPSELWRTDLELGKTERILPEFSVIGYDIAPLGQQVVFSTKASEEGAEIWLAWLDGSAPPKRIGSTRGPTEYAGPYFGPENQVLFVMRDGNANYLTRMKNDGSGVSKVFSDPVSGIYGGVSSDRRWAAVSLPAQDIRTGAIAAVPAAGGAPRRICEGYRPVAWGPEGRFFYIGVARSTRTSPGKTLAIPLPPGGTLPDLPAGITCGPEDAAAFPGSRLIDGWTIAPGPDPSVFAYVKMTMHRNLFRIQLPR